MHLLNMSHNIIYYIVVN